MRASRKFPLLPHEVVFGAFLVIVWLRLALAQGVTGGLALLYFGLIVGNVAVIVWSRRRETNFRWRIRLLAYPILMNVVFLGMGVAVEAMHASKTDALLEQIDVTLFGATPCLALEAVVTPVLTEALSFCYILFFPYLAFSIV